MRLRFTFRDEFLDLSCVELLVLELVLLHGNEDGCGCTATATNVVPLAVAKSYRVLIDYNREREREREKRQQSSLNINFYLPRPLDQVEDLASESLSHLSQLKNLFERTLLVVHNSLLDSAYLAHLDQAVVSYIGILLNPQKTQTSTRLNY